jgi:DNA-binding HxlR family transcriptional regulator
MRRSIKTSNPCPIHGLLELLARPWTLHILWALSTNGPARFGSLHKQIDGISSRVLAQRLRTLEQKEFVSRDYVQTIPPSVTYRITKRMKDIEKVLQELEQLARCWKLEELPPPRRKSTRERGKRSLAS